MTPAPVLLPSTVGEQVWQLDAAAQLLATLDERYAALRAALRAPIALRHTLLAQLDAADIELCMARASFLDAICQLHVEKWSRPRPLAHEYMFDALDILWDFEAAWENALDKNAVGIDPFSLASASDVASVEQTQELNHEQ